MKKKHLLYSLLASIYLVVILMLTIFLKLSQTFDKEKFLNFLLFGLIVFTILTLISIFKLFRLYFSTIITIIISGLYLFIAMPKDPVGFTDIAIIIGFLFIIGIGIFIGILLEIIKRIKAKKIKSA